MGRVGGRGTSQVVHAVFSRRRPVPAAGLPTAWTSALDRFARSVHRFHDRVEVIADRRLRRRLQDCGARLEAALAAARARSRGPARRLEPSPTVRALLRAGTLCAHATECAVAAAAASRAKDADDVARHLDDVRAVVDELLAELGGELDTEHPADEPRRARG